MKLSPDPAFRRSLWALLAAGVLVFALFIPANLHGAWDIDHMTTGDEHVTYPYVLHMLQPSQSLSEFWWRLIIYGDYHYGYPFYFASALVLLPQRLVLGQAFFEQTTLNLLVLRQLINILPLLLAAGLLVYLQTRFRSSWRSAGLFLFILAVPGVVRQNIQWWHPDALALLAVALTLFWLERDRLRFGHNFWLAAAACGLATAIKLQGPFFVLVVAGYLLAGWRQRRASAWRTALLGAGFAAVMAAVTVVSNPFLFYPSQVEKLLQIQSQKQAEMNLGYTDREDPALYQKGPQYWRWTLETWFGPLPLLAGLAAALVAGCLWGSHRFANRLILGWAIPLSLYLLYGVAPKPDHYWLPVMLPLFSLALAPLDLLVPWAGKFSLAWLKKEPAGARSKPAVVFTRIASMALVLLLCAWFAANLLQAAGQYADALVVDQVRYNLPN